MHSRDDFDAALALAGDKLVMLDVYSDEQCDLQDGAVWDKAPTWQTSAEAHEAMMEPCRRVSNVFQRVARECTNVEFLSLDADESADAELLVQELGITKLPTVQFWRNGELLWQQEGAGDGATRNIGEGILYYSGNLADGEKVGGLIEDVGSKTDLEAWLAECALPGTGPGGVNIDVACDKQMQVLDVSLAKDSAACVHAYAAVVALAKNLQGAVRWGRVLADADDSSAALAKELGVQAFPTFVMHVEGKEVGRYVGSDRVELMQKVLEVQKKCGVRLPEPPPRKRMSQAEARKIQQEQRARAKAAGVRPQGW